MGAQQSIVVPVPTSVAAGTAVEVGHLGEKSVVVGNAAFTATVDIQGTPDDPDGSNPRPHTIAATDIDSVDYTTDLLTEATHGLETGDGPVQLTTTGTLPAGLSLLTDYWIIKVSANTFRLATSLDDALDGTYVSFTDNGTGTHTYTGTASCERVAAEWSDLSTGVSAGDVVAIPGWASAVRANTTAFTSGDPSARAAGRL